MSLREDLKNYVPMYLWEEINHPEGYIVGNVEFNTRWNLIRTQNDQQANVLRDILQMLYQTILHDTDGASHIRVALNEYASNNLKGVLLIVDQRLKDLVAALAAHKQSGDHDFRYYTKTLLDGGQLDHRYYTKTLIDGKLTTINTNHSQLVAALNAHKQSKDHDNRYYTKDELIPWLRGGDTYIREEVFVIVNPNNGDGTFTYTQKGEPKTGDLTSEGQPIFELVEGFYDLGSNRLEVMINDTLRRSVASGGIIEMSPTSFILTDPEGAGAEITAKYYERIGVAAEYNIKLGPTKPPKNDGKNMWFEVLE